MKKFTKLESGKHISEGVEVLKEFNSLQKKLEKDLSRVVEIARIADEFELPQIDMISRVEVIEKIDQYTFVEDVREMTPYSTLENVERTSYKEIEVKRVDDTLVYTIMQDEIKAVGKAGLKYYSYIDAVEIAKSKAIIDMERQKLEKITKYINR